MDNIQAAIDAGKQLATAKEAATIHRVTPEGVPFLLINGQTVDVQHLLTKPVRRKVKAEFKDLQSFIEYVNEFKRSQSKIFAEFGEHGGSFTAALDYHSTTEASFVEDKATYSCPTTKEWDKWLEHDAEPFAQVDFAHFVEEQTIAFKNPTGATMLDIARSLEAKTEGEFKSGINLANGDRELLYTEVTNATAGGKEKLSIPSKITVYLQPFFHGAYYQIEALLRYRVSNGRVVFVYELQKVHETVDAALQQIRNEITEKTQITPYIGTF